MATWYASVCGECPSRLWRLGADPGRPGGEGGGESESSHLRWELSAPGGIHRFRVCIIRTGSASPMLRGADGFSAHWLGRGRGSSCSNGSGEACNHIFLAGRMGPSLTDLVDDFLAGRRWSPAGIRGALRGPPQGGYTDRVRPEPPAHLRLRPGPPGLLLRRRLPRDLAFPGGIPTGFRPDGRSGRAWLQGAHGGLLAPRLSLTGQNADEWVPFKPGSEAVVALAMAHVIVRDGGDAGPYYARLLEGYDPQECRGGIGGPGG